MITFDPTTKRIILDVTNLSATTVYSRSIDWLVLSDNAKYDAIFRYVGGDDLGAGKSMSPFFFLRNGWRIRPMEADQIVTFTGYIFTEEGDNPFVPTLGAYNVQINSVIAMEAQTLLVSTGSGLSFDQDKALTDTLNAAQAANIQATKGRKMQTNKAIISSDGLSVSIYEDDGATLLHSFTVSSDKNTRVPV